MKIHQLHTGDPDKDATGNRGIGGSAASCIYGANRYKSAYKLWAELSGLTTDDFTGNAATEAGQMFERPILEKYAEKENVAVAVLHATLVHPEFDFVLGNVDAFEVEPTDEYPRGVVTDTHDLDFAPLSLVEIKTTGIVGRGNAKAWANEGVPLTYEFQGLHYCAITGLNDVTYVALVGGEGLQIRRRAYSNEQIEKLVVDECAFWELVKSGHPPEIDESDSTKEALSQQYPEPEEGLVVEAGEAMLGCLEQYASAKQAESDAKNEVNYWRNQLVAQIGNAEAVSIGGQIAATYKVVQRKEHTVKASSSRVLSLKKGKGE